jgi:hypothetical protein
MTSLRVKTGTKEYGSSNLCAVGIQRYRTGIFEAAAITIKISSITGLNSKR